MRQKSLSSRLSSVTGSPRSTQASSRFLIASWKTSSRLRRSDAPCAISCSLIARSPAPAPAPVAAAPAEDDGLPVPTSLAFSPAAQQTVPLKTHEELKAKFRIIENKRLEDREKLKELDRVKSELQTLAAVRQKQDETVKDLQKQLKDVRREYAEYREHKENEQSAADLMENIESLTIDKEVAEEKADALQQEVDSLKERVEELSLEIEILKNDKEEGGGGGGGGTVAP
eukprot:Unigene2369_Nuclearia_a/m.7300 Unigene2369_Nuclearia_a/g.7300  ORF Unigene2369_Nuclearia_a/g.7300 Unigene2369_Nuclearia_a/m.7300 type:complete len:229 (-) Unigene2369_Nuclearia_a:136-822(-)